MKQPTATIVGKFFNISEGEGEEGKALFFLSPENKAQTLLSLEAFYEILKIAEELQDIGDSSQAETQTGFIKGEKVNIDLFEFTFGRKDSTESLNEPLVLGMENLRQLADFVEDARYEFTSWTNRSEGGQPMGLGLNLTTEQLRIKKGLAS
jgi:hypothetical protein